MIQLKNKNIVFHARMICSEARKKFSEEIKKEFSMSWNDVLFTGIVSILKEKHNVLASVAVNSYVTAYYTYSIWNSRKKHSTVDYKLAHIYWILKTFNNKYLIFYKDDDGFGNPTGEILTTKKSMNQLDKSIADQFDLGLTHLIPD